MIGEERRPLISNLLLWLVLALAILYVLLWVCGVRVARPDRARESVSSSPTEAAEKRRPVEARKFGRDPFPEFRNESADMEDPDEEVLR